MLSVNVLFHLFSISSIFSTDLSVEKERAIVFLTVASVFVELSFIGLFVVLLVLLYKGERKAKLLQWYHRWQEKLPPLVPKNRILSLIVGSVIIFGISVQLIFDTLPEFFVTRIMPRAVAHDLFLWLRLHPDAFIPLLFGAPFEVLVFFYGSAIFIAVISVFFHALGVYYIFRGSPPDQYADVTTYLQGDEK